MVKNSKGSGVALVVAIVVVLILCFVAAYFIPLGVYAERAKANTTYEFEDNQNIILVSRSSLEAVAVNVPDYTRSSSPRQCFTYILWQNYKCPG